MPSWNPGTLPDMKPSLPLALALPLSLLAGCGGGGEDENQALIDAMLEQDRIARESLPHARYVAPSETYFSEGAVLRHVAEHGDEGTPPEVVETLTRTLQELEVRKQPVGQLSFFSVDVTEEQRRAFAALLVEQYGASGSFDAVGLNWLLEQYVNEGDVEL